MRKKFMHPKLTVKRFSAEIVTALSGITLNSAESEALTALEAETGVTASGKYVISLNKVNSN